jgi:hypothetical protein
LWHGRNFGIALPARVVLKIGDQILGENKIIWTNQTIPTCGISLNFFVMALKIKSVYIFLLIFHLIVVCRVLVKNEEMLQNLAAIVSIGNTIPDCPNVRGEEPQLKKINRP